MSPKNKGKFGKAKASAVAPTDEFISGIDRILRAVKPHGKPLAVFVGVVVAIVLVYTTWTWWQDRKLAHATEIYARALLLSEVPVHPPAKADDKSKDKDKAEPERPPDPRGLPTEFASSQERARAVVTALDQLSSDYGSTTVARQGLLLQAAALYELDRYADAAEKYRAYAGGGGPEDLVLAAREGFAYSLEAKAMAEKDPKERQAGLEKTLQAFRDMQPQADGPRHDEALYHQARILAELGKKDEARVLLEQIKTDYPNSTLKQDVEMRLPALRAAR